MAWCWASEQKVLQLVHSWKGLYVYKIISFRTWLLKTLKGLSDLLRCLYNGASHSSCKDQNWSSFLLQRPGKNPVAIKIKQLPRFLFLLFSQETPLLSSSDCQLRFRPITPPVVHIFKFCWNASIIKKHAVAALTFPHWWFFRDETSKRILSPRWAQALSIERGTSPSLPKFPSSPLWAQAFIWWKLSNSISSLHRAFLKIRLVEPQARGLFTLSQKLGPGLWARAQAHSNSWSFYLNLAFISTFVYRWQG